MKATLRYSFMGLTFAGLTFLSTSCRKDLCYDHDEHGLSVKVNLSSDWEQEWERTYAYDWEKLWEEDWKYDYEDLCPAPADGIRVQVYTSDGQRIESNLPDEGGRVAMPEGTHELLFYNNDTEYIVFDGVAASESATATTRGVTRSSFQELHAGERTVNQPDMLYGAYIGSYEALPTQETVGLPVRLQPLTYTYLVRYEFQQGFQYVALARGALAGMAESVYLNDGHTGPEAATVMFDCTLRDYGPEATVKSFGIPDYPGDHYGDGTRTTERSYHLNLEVRLHNGAMKTFEFDVTDQVKAQPRGGVIIVSDGLVITDEEGAAGSDSGFDIDVEGWGDYIDIPLPL